MKKTGILLTIVLCAGFLSAQDLKTDTLLVYGNCEMCQKRIQAAAAGKGVKSAEWEIYTGRLVVRYKPDKTSLDQIEKRIAAAGHDTENFNADDKVYERLHHCCQYERKPDKPD